MLNQSPRAFFVYIMTIRECNILLKFKNYYHLIANLWIYYLAQWNLARYLYQCSSMFDIPANSRTRTLSPNHTGAATSHQVQNASLHILSPLLEEPLTQPSRLKSLPPLERPEVYLSSVETTGEVTFQIKRKKWRILGHRARRANHGRAQIASRMPGNA